MTYAADTEARARDRVLGEEQAALRRVATLVAEGPTAAQLFAAVANEVAQVLDAPTVMLGRYEPDRQITVLASLNEPSFTAGSRWPLDGPSVSATVLDTGRPGRIDDYSDLPGAIAAGVRASAIGSTVGVPITVDGRVWGMITVGTRESERLPADIEDRLSEFTELVAIAISNAESRDELRQLADEQAALRRVATLIAAGATPSEVFAAVAKEVANTLDVPLTAVVRYESDETATQVGAWGRENPFPIGTHWTLDEQSVSGLVASSGRPARVTDYSDVPGAISSALARDAGIRTAVGVPILVDGKPWGVMMALSTEQRELPADTEARLAAFTELLATAIANTENREGLTRLAEEQTALRRVATLVAGAAPPDQVFAAVAEEVARLLALPRIEMVRYDPDGTGTVIGASGDHPFPVGSHWTFDGPSIMATVLHTGRPARIDDFGQLPGTIAEIARGAGFRSAIGAPIIVGGATWGSIIAISTVPEPIPEGSELRLSQFTELVATAVSNLQAHDDLRGLADEQAALHRVARLVAEGIDSSALFDVVCAEAGQLVGASTVNLSRYTPDGFNLTIAGWSLRDTHVPNGTRFPLTSDTVGGVIVRTHAPARVDSWEGASSELAKLVRDRGIRSSLGAPVVVEGQLWGALVAATDREDALPAGTEFRLARFTELIATAISNAATRSELIASRARIVAAGDEARRRIERNLHDGTQQRLIALGLDLQRIRAMLPEGQQDALSGLDRMGEDLESVLADVRELSRGLHPPLLSRGGLRASLRALARRSSIPVDLDIDLPERPPASLETAVYYVVSEALTNAIKHSRASAISVTVATDHAGGPFGVGLDGSGRSVDLHATIADDGVGGAEASVGSGLMGLLDRVDALGGRFVLDSPPGRGTRISIELPLGTPARS